MVRLTTLLAICTATTNEIKDFLFGKAVDFSDNVTLALLSITGFNSWDIKTKEERGVGRMIAEKVTPPLKLIDLAEEVIVGKQKSYTVTYGEKERIGAIRSVPVVGKPLYDWFGIGVTEKEDKEETQNLIE